MSKYLIINADDFGASSGINRGILESHTRGVVTSASLMVTGRAVLEAVAMCRDHPGLAIGLHFDISGEDEQTFDLGDAGAVRAEFTRQLDQFFTLLGRSPTHVDSHRHVHRLERLNPLFRQLVTPLQVPLRDDGRVRFVGGFYAQWEWLLTNLEYVGVPHLERMLVEEVHPGWNEFSCHPGYLSSDFSSVYLAEREVEVRTLTDPRIAGRIQELGITLASYADYRNSRTPLQNDG